MAKIEVQAPFEKGAIIPKGEHVLKLTEVKQVRINSQFSKEEDGKVDKYIWIFLSTDKDPENGKPYEYPIFTNTKYGNDKASLTQLLNQLVPEMDEEMAADFDTDDIVGSRFEAMIRHEKAPTGEMFAKHTYIMPFRSKKKKAVVEDEDMSEGEAEFDAAMVGS